MKLSVGYHALVLWVAVVAFSGKLSAQRPNILVIMTDQQSADAMSFMQGDRYISTPHMDSLAENGTVFTRAYCANPLCTPSRSSMLTGRYNHELGIQANEHRPIDTDLIPTMGTLFRSQGYETAYFGKWHIPIPAREHSKHGFEWMDYVKLGGGVDSLIPGAVREFLQKERNKPFLLVASFSNPHDICQWARADSLPEGKVGQPGSLDDCPPLLPNHLPTRNENDINRDMRLSIQANPQFPVGDFDETRWRQYRWAYFRMIEKVDQEIGSVLAALRESGELQHTLIVFLSDHGDMQGAHGWNQKTVFYEESARVPFILCAPELAGKKSDVLVQTGVDLMPTICSYAGIALPPAMPGTDVLGSKARKRDYIVSSNRLAVGRNIFPDRQTFVPEGRMVRGQRYKYWIYDDGQQRESLFDLLADPGEMTDLAKNGAYTGELEKHRQYLKEWAEEHGDRKAAEMLKDIR